MLLHKALCDCDKWQGFIRFLFTEQKKKILHRPRSVARELIPCRPLSRRGWNPIKLAYKLARWPAQLSTSAFNQLGQYANSPGHRAYCYTELADFFHSGSRNHR